MEDTGHELPGFLSEMCRGAQLRWAIAGKDGHAIVDTHRRLEYLLWGGVTMLTDYRNLAKIFHPEACVTPVSKSRF